MLVVYKGNIVFKVALEGDSVRIQPVVGRFDNAQLLQTLARNEELLVQVYVAQHKMQHMPAAVARYFEQRGWLVRLTPSATEDTETGAWAES